MSYTEYLSEANMPAGKKKIILAAIDLFSKKGFHGTSTAKIAETAGMSQATLFKYFKTKDDLLNSIISAGFPPILASFVAGINQEKNLEDMIHLLVFNRFEFMKKNQKLVRIFFQEFIINKEFNSNLKNMIKNGPINPKLKKLYLILSKSDKHFNNNLSITQVFRIIMGPLFAYFSQCFIFYIESENEEEDLLLIEKQIYQSLIKNN
ncbi:transcriptional regulator, TetR family [Gemella bergeri ATCC 700627]|uniref:Transcriptional regulator, TetR family n=2 Tax=Gemella bergeri TaxID=84136 RepID=U2RSH3_9BACL|nr:transcriptional regulator, TetR family [Gemella bergeri ATCC 700627]